MSKGKGRTWVAPVGVGVCGMAGVCSHTPRTPHLCSLHPERPSHAITPSAQVVLLFLYPTLNRRTTSINRCVTYVINATDPTNINSNTTDNITVLQSSLSTTCEGEDYNRLQRASIIFFLLYGIGIPLLFPLAGWLLRTVGRWKGTPLDPSPTPTLFSLSKPLPFLSPIPPWTLHQPSPTSDNRSTAPVTPPPPPVLIEFGNPSHPPRDVLEGLITVGGAPSPPTWGCSECYVLWQASPVSRPAALVLCLVARP